jgi:hypothetical protein
LREQHLRAGELDSRQCRLEVEVVRDRFVDQRRQHGIVEREPPVLE